ncbi:MAG TPA: hypothetical protein VJQ45_12550 [Ktedonobacterales bacterium]|nr:hypothetical protein [Ktedonobacterales bacterium]
MPGPWNGAIEKPGARRGSLRRAAYLTCAVGAAHAVLFLLSYWLLSNAPGSRASDSQIAAFYHAGNQRHVILAGLYLMPFAGIAFIWFIVTLRMWIAAQLPRENALLSNVQLVSGILYVALFFATAAAISALPASVEFSSVPISPIMARLFPQFGFALLFVFAMRMAAMFVFTTSSIARSAGVLPRWFIYLGYLVGLFLLLSATFSPLLVLIFPLWLLTLCALLLWRARALSAERGTFLSSPNQGARTTGG